jgi:hypothetical protein
MGLFIKKEQSTLRFTCRIPCSFLCHHVKRSLYLSTLVKHLMNRSGSTEEPLQPD